MNNMQTLIIITGIFFMVFVGYFTIDFIMQPKFNEHERWAFLLGFLLMSGYACLTLSSFLETKHKK